MSAASSEAREADARARRLAQCSFDRPLALEAGAGTGKTATLVARVLAWVLGPGWERARTRGARRPGDEEAIAAQVLSRVCAITFTEAAAAEMAERIGIGLAAIEAGEPFAGLDVDVLPEDRDECARRARALLTCLDQLAVHTIHAFCRRLLGRHSLGAGLHPAFRVDADESAQARVVREVVETAFVEAYAANAQGPLHELAVAGWGPADVEHALGRLVATGVRADSLERDPFSPECCDALRAVLARHARRLSGAVSERLAGVSRSRGSLAVVRALEETVGLVDAGPLADAAALAELVRALDESWTATARERLRQWSRGRFNVEETQRLGEASAPAREHAGALFEWLVAAREIDPVLLDTGRRALAPLLGRACAELRRRGIATFASLLGDAAQLLRDHPDVLREEREALDLLLVDEFQDTDPIQCEIIRRLALDGPAASGPALFLVGDPKQSIYGWRDADLRAYDSFQELLVSRGGERHSLVVNFRSAPAILEEVQRCVEPVMQRRLGVQPGFEPLLPCDALREHAGFDRGGARPVEHWVSWPRDDDERVTATEAAALEARAVAADAVRLHREHGVAWSAIALLFRSMGDADRYLEALREAGVPYRVERDRSYYRRREIIEAAAAVRCVLEPADEFALLAFLRSSAVGAPDAALWPLWSRGLPGLARVLERADDGVLDEIRGVVEAAADAVPGGVPGLERIPDWRLPVLAAFESLALLRESFERDAADVFVENLRRLLLSEAGEASRFLGRYRVANLDRFYRELRDELAEGGDPHALLRRLRVDVASGREAEEASPRDDAAEAVRVLTIHMAKGLDFDHVYVVQLHRGSRAIAAPDFEGAWCGDRFEYRLFGATTPGFARVRERRVQVEAAERVRALYVAMTRARERLVLLGAWPKRETAGDDDPVQARTPLGLLAARRDTPADLRGRMSALAASRADGSGETGFDHGGARWVFPALASDSGRAAGGMPPGVRLPPASEVAAASRRLDAARVAATGRMAHRLESTPSDWSEVGGRSAARRSSGAHERAVARAAGTAVHRALEDFDLGGDPEAELARQRERLERYLAADEALAGEHAAAAAKRARDLFDRFGRGPLFERFRELRTRIVARELPISLAIAREPRGDDAGPPGVVTGRVDLVYRESADSGEWVVVDYKSDAVDGEAEAIASAEGHRAQAELYRRALCEALALASPPRVDLWFLQAGCVVTLDPAASER